jgi:hypothetical protein
MATVYEIIQGISQAAANAYDGSHYERYSSDGEIREVGLERERGDPLIDSRVMDGFSVRFQGNHLIVSYHSEMPLKAVHNTKLDEDVEEKFASIAKFLKKEYKSVTGDSLSLSDQGDANILLQNMSNIRTWVQATKAYQIGNLKGVEEISQGSAKTPEEKLNDTIKDFLEMGKPTYSKAKKPSNVTRK